MNTNAVEVDPVEGGGSVHVEAERPAGDDGGGGGRRRRWRRRWRRTAENDDPTSNDGDDDADDDGDGDGEKKGISLQELIYAAASYNAVLKPVSVTMILAALAVIYINTDQTKAAGEKALDQTYQVFTISEDQSAAASLGLGLVNALIIVCVIGCMTFLIVLLYKYRCMKFLMGYMMLASVMLLGFLGGQMFYVAINKYRLEIDQISFYVTMYNFAVVGVIAVFYGKGVPTYISQAYLVATSVIVAWQLSYFNDWMAWTLLIMLALYDLCAVLTPCGPLKALVNLMSKDDAPSMPGLLYEAQLPSNATRPGRTNRRRNNDGVQNENRSAEAQQESAPSGNGQVVASESDAVANGEERINTEGYASFGNVGADENETNAGVEVVVTRESSTEGHSAVSNVGAGESYDNFGEEHLSRDTNTERDDAVDDSVPETKQQPPTAAMVSSSSHRKRRSNRRTESSEEAISSRGTMHSESIPTATPSQREKSAPRTTTLPLAIAKVYKLPIVSPLSLEESIDFYNSSPTAYLQQEFAPAELQTDVEVKLPRNGGRIEATRNKKGEPRYVVYNRDGEVKRTLLVDENGKVLELIPRDDDGEDDGSDNNIKLGLGDFIFYSVLVSKAAGNGFAAFVSCFLSILAGLGGTLVLLAVYHHALPALPISIFLAVVMFVLTIYCMEPWVQDMWRAGPYYV